MATFSGAAANSKKKKQSSPIFRIQTKTLSNFCCSILRAKVEELVLLVKDMSFAERKCFVGLLGQALSVSELLKLGGAVKSPAKNTFDKRKLPNQTSSSNQFTSSNISTAPSQLLPFWMPSPTAQESKQHQPIHQTSSVPSRTSNPPKTEQTKTAKNLPRTNPKCYSAPQQARDVQKPIGVTASTSHPENIFG